MSIIDVMIVIDCATVIEEFGTNSDANNPVQVTTADLISMMTVQADAIKDQGGNELNVKAVTGDVIRWREESLSLNADYNTILYKFVAYSGGDLISTPQPLEMEITSPLPNPQDPLKPNTQTIKDYFWQSTVLMPGSVTYHFSFMILDRDSNVQGYFWWDPFITISNN